MTMKLQVVFSMIIGQIILAAFSLVNKLVCTCPQLSQLKCMSMDFVALGDMVLVIRSCANELSVVTTVFGFACPIW